ncbi:hypothetical protein HAX54_041531 [Datura stramonium]|uniref:Uncharacterized protein n=1 Tax=Datura stramonium TaxID=4076 RepID=A0ABS8RH17_DATST|nr:hypothetical protein [Datura stramonium]
MWDCLFSCNKVQELGFGSMFLYQADSEGLIYRWLTEIVLQLSRPNRCSARGLRGGIMPPPARHCRHTMCLPLSFSPFARSMARIASNNKVTHKFQNSRFPGNNLPSSSGIRMVNHGLIDKGEDYGSSDDEEFDTYLDDKQCDLSDFVDVILGQPTVGTVVKIENDEDDGIYSIITALNLGRYKDLECMADLKEFLLKACHRKDVFSKLSLFLGDQAKNVGLMVSQLVVNLPPQLLPPLYDALFDEVSWATEDELKLRSSFCFKFYLVISKIYKHKNADKQNMDLVVIKQCIHWARPKLSRVKLLVLQFFRCTHSWMRLMRQVLFS